VILTLSAHPDDSEIGAGGLLSKNKEVIHCIFSDCSDTGVTREEIECAQNALGISDYFVHSFVNRELYKSSMKIREIMEELRDRFDPDMVIAPCTRDTHQDHRTVVEEAMKVFKKTTLIGYILPWNTYNIEPTLFCRLRDVEVRKKISSLRCYSSQSSKLYMEPDRIRGWARYIGWKIGTDYAEGFEIIRMVI